MDQSFTERGGPKSARDTRSSKLSNRNFFDDEYDDELPGRAFKSVRRYHSDVKTEEGRAPADIQSSTQSMNLPRPKKKVPPRRTAATQGHAQVTTSSRRAAIDTEDMVGPKKSKEPRRIANPKQNVHILVYVGVGLVVMVIGWMALTLLSNWWLVAQDDWRYGRPRTYQADEVVGHNNDSETLKSHFIALNMNRHVEIIECPAGDCSKAKIYVGPDLIGPNQDLTPVTLSFQDVNGDKSLDMIVHIQDTRIVFINDNGAFRNQKPNEKVNLD
ncbi:hypothetical protein [Ktedonospora formicarum]|uniref:VCBS repeat-containing protein n=1 Tax=Ktedonospora formicarum TaxID=2778364 RepID=A0A8J3MRC6_9CHLR|nr:hypothetical protein [Ktedonospora formicarum]GHO43498.1 hypothetical protein KSX_16610 [Ktedonospora formicarum]